MSQALKRIIELWSEADLDARSAEHMLTQAYADIFSTRDIAASPELIDQVARMRARSNELLTEALVLLKAKTAASGTVPKGGIE